MNRVLVLAVHPDDETIGCGGTLLRHKAEGDEIYWLMATSMKEEDGFTKKEVRNRKNQIDAAARSYNFNGVYKLGISTKKVDLLPKGDVINKISEIFHKVKPNMIYLPFMNDIHSDHRIIFELAFSCTKVFRYPFIKKTLMMETISETEFAPSLKGTVFTPNHFVDITNFLDKKIKLLKVFNNEIKKPPFPRSIENIKSLATLRGSMAGCKYAESFMILKDIR